jgi:hypothetical protein
MVEQHVNIPCGKLSNESDRCRLKIHHEKMAFRYGSMQFRKKVISEEINTYCRNIHIV